MSWKSLQYALYLGVENTIFQEILFIHFLVLTVEMCMYSFPINGDFQILRMVLYFWEWNVDARQTADADPVDNFNVSSGLVDYHSSQRR